MKTITSILAIIALLAAAPAQAATAYLVSCNPGSSVTGRLAYVGTYQYGGQYFTRTFGGLCPLSVEVY